MGRKFRYYDSNFKLKAVRLVLADGRSISDVERSPGITPGSIEVMGKCVALLRKPLVPISIIRIL